MATIGLSFEPDLISVMNGLDRTYAVMNKHIATATEKSAGLIGTNMVDDMYTYFQNPTGQLEDSVNVVMLTEYLAYIYADEPYAWRRERGFSGMTDSLGRYYSNDPGIYYAELTIQNDAVLQEIAENYIEAIFEAWTECMGNLPKGASAFISTAL